MYLYFIFAFFLVSCGGLDTHILKTGGEFDSGVSGVSGVSGDIDEDSDIDVDTDVDTDTDADTDSDIDTGILLEGIVGYTSFTLRQLACPACMGETREVSVSFYSEFHEPITDSHIAWIPEAGSCRENLYETSPSTNPIDIGERLTVIGPVHSFSVPMSAPGTYETSAIYETQYDRDSTFEVSSTVLDDTFRFNSLHGFDYIEPYEMLYVDPSYAYAAPVYRTGTTFMWGPSGSDSEFMIIVAVYTPDGASLLGYVTCVGLDTGLMTIPSAYLSSYPPGAITAIHMSREKLDESPFYGLGGYVETHVGWEVVGTGYIH